MLTLSELISLSRNNGAELEKPRDLSDLAERIVLLIGQTEVAGFAVAEELLIEFYKGDHQKVAKAYELACTVVLRRILRGAGHTSGRDTLRPFATWMLGRATQEAIEGLLQESFRHLRISLKAGASQSQCRKVAGKILEQLDSRNRVCVLVYRKERVVSIDVGRIDEVGIMIMSGKDQKHPMRNRRGLEEAARNERLFLRNAEEWARERISGQLQPQKRSKGRSAKESFGDSLKWAQYFEFLCVVELDQSRKVA